MTAPTDTALMRPRRLTAAPQRLQASRWLETAGYAISDPYKPASVSYWVVASPGATPQPWPTHTARYGPPPPRRGDPTLTKDQRKAAREAWKLETAVYRRRVLEALLADPDGARAMFSALTNRCSHCRVQVSVTTLPDSAAWERPEYQPQQRDEQHS